MLIGSKLVGGMGGRTLCHLAGSSQLSSITDMTAYGCEFTTIKYFSMESGSSPTSCLVSVSTPDRCVTMRISPSANKKEFIWSIFNILFIAFTLC